MPATETTVREIALENPGSIHVFEEFGIDYCCGGHKALTQACRERALEPSVILAALDAAREPAEKLGIDWSNVGLDSLCEHIVTKHHASIRAEVPRLMQFAQQVVARHGDRHPELVEVQELVRALGEELMAHIGKEEAVLFPYITNLVRNLTQCGPPAMGCFGTVKAPIRVMLADHEAAGELMAQIREASGNYTAPAGACPTWQGFYLTLDEFERDLHQHVHLENNILFPQAIELEESCG
jgi:regulator of cell morphogenesis and NO signaling